MEQNKEGIEPELDDIISEEGADEDLNEDDKPLKVSGGDSLSKKASKPGIVYLSRVPPLMRPQRVKKIFSRYGEIGRVFLQAEDKFNRKTRKKKGGSKSKRFTEGWIEFMDKKIAKSIALTFNNTPIGGRKRSIYYEELWNLKYLHRFQWAHLAERLEYERQVRQQRIRTEISQVKRETGFYMKSVELGDQLVKQEKKTREKGKEWIARVRSHKQRVTQDEFEDTKPRKSGKVSKNTLGMIFKKTSKS
nr:activator of basal transcription 1-like [Lytechinus pictus]